MSQFLFLVNTSKEEGQGKPRDQELVPAAALSHAAKVSHQRRKGKEARHKDVILAAGRPRNSGEPSMTVVQTQELSEDEEELLKLVGPLTILIRGNSDPFQAVAISVTPRVNEILSFFKNSFLPAMYQSDTEMHYRSFSADSAWDLHRTALHEECSGHAFVLIGLSILGQVANPASDALENEKLVLKVRLFSSLRGRIEKSAETDRAVLDSVMFLFAAEGIAGNFVQATMHGRVLRTLLRKRFERTKTSPVGLVDQIVLTHALYYDTVLSLLYMKLPIFALDPWVGETLDPIFRPLDQYTEPLQLLFVNDLDGSLDGDPLRSTFIQVRLAIWLWTQPKPINDADRGALSLWVMGWTHLYKAILVKHYLDLKSLLRSDGADASLKDEDIPIITQSCLTLGLLIYFMSFGGDPTIAGRPLLQIYETLFIHLKATISLIVANFEANSPSMMKYQNAHLWILFLGAQAEHKAPTLSSPNVSKAWFYAAFGCLARRMGLLTWEMIRVRLTYFWYSDAVETHGSVWVPECLARAGGGTPAVNLGADHYYHQLE